MTKVGRNDKCECGSGLKFKHCCGKVVNKGAMRVVGLTDVDVSYDANIITIFNELVSIVQKLNWGGACHSVSAILYVLFKELGLNAKLYIGEVESHKIVFDHSWVELDGDIYDVAICLSERGQTISNPIFASYDTILKRKTNLVYATRKGRGLDTIAKTVASMSIVEYMDSFPIDSLIDNSNRVYAQSIYDFSTVGLWGFVISIGAKVGLHLNVDDLRLKYTSMKRVLKSSTNYSVGEIRRNLLKLEDGGRGFYLDIPKRGRIEFYRKGDVLFIVNPNSKDDRSLHIERDCLNRGVTEIEKDMLFGVFLENVKNLHLTQIGL